MNKLTVVIGDIHGCLEEFDEILKAIEYHPDKMRVVLAGDLMDRGPDQVGCVRRARELNLECVMGNHEDKHLRWHKHEVKRLQTGRKNPMKSLSENDTAAHNQLSEDDIEWMNKLPRKIQIADKWWAVHAGCEPCYSFANQSDNQIIRVRYVDENGRGQSLGPNFSQPENTKYWTEMWKGPESIVYGHCVHSKTVPRFDYLENDVTCVGLDTGCVFGGTLTAMMMHPNQPGTRQFFQVKAKQTYFQGYGLGDE
jgi:hypothetical protein